jgi:hypothetical protein
LKVPQCLHRHVRANIEAIAETLAKLLYWKNKVGATQEWKSGRR